MPSRNEGARVRARLQETPVCDDATLLKLQDQAADYVREAKRRDASESNELLSAVIDAVARDYFRHIMRKHRRDASRHARISPSTRFPRLRDPDHRSCPSTAAWRRIRKCWPRTAAS